MPDPLVITTPTDRQIVITRGFEAPRDLVFLCYSKPELMRRWYGVPEWRMTVCDIDFRVGGKYRLVTVGPDGTELASGGSYLEIVEPELIRSTETYDDNWTGGETINEIRFTEAAGGTLATTTLTFPSKEMRDGVIASPMATGMEIGFRRLDAVLAEEQAA